jgi:histone H1/5
MSDAVAAATQAVADVKAKTPKKKAATGSKAAKKPSDHPKYSEMVHQALGSLKERGGSSRQAILKYIMKNFKVGNDENVVNTHLKMSLRAGIKNASLKQSKGTGAAGSFRLGEEAKKPKKVAAKKPKKAPAAKKSPKKAGAKSPKKLVKKPAAAKKPKTDKPAKKAKADKPKKAATPKKAKAAKPKKAAAPKKPASAKPAKKAASPKKAKAAKPAAPKAKKPAAAKKA